MKYDAIIIGFGKGGKTLAGLLAKMGKKVAIIEKSDKMYGGTCINVGCIPSKSLVTSGLKTDKSANFTEKAEHYKKAVEEKRRVVTMLRGKNFDKLNDLENVDVITGTASFVDKNTIQVETAQQNMVLTAEQIFINTGSTSVVPNIKGIQDNEHVFYSDSLMDLQVLPKQLVIVGGGYIGLEFSSIYANFGSSVTILQDSDIFLPREDEDIAAAIKENLQSLGVDIVTGVSIEQVEKDGSVVCSKEGQRITKKADAVLIATGRKPNTDSLNLQAAGVKTTPRGAVEVDENLKTSADNIWALGDVNGGLQFTYISLDDYRIVANQLSEKNSYTLNDRKNVPYSVFISPSFSRVGLNEKEARQQGYNVKVAKIAAAAIPKAQVLKSTKGMLKAIIDADTNKILGAMLFCEESYEMINIVKLAMDTNCDYTVLRDQIFTHPTMSEALNDLFNI